MKKEKLHILSNTSYCNGDPIPQAQDAEEWKKYKNAGQGAYCKYVDENDNETEYILYNWFVLDDKRGIIPKEMKLADTNDWCDIEKELEKDESLSTFLKRGQREIFGFFQGFGKGGYYWSNLTSEHNSERAIFFSILNSGGNEIFEADCDKRLGLSILCIKK